MSMNKKTVKISNKKSKRNIDDLYKEVKKAFSDIKLNDGLQFTIKKEDKHLKVTMIIKKWDYSILVTIESIVFIYVLLLSSKIPIKFDFLISKEMSNIGDLLGNCITKIKENINDVENSDGLKDLIMNSFENLYKIFENSTLRVGIDKKYLQEAPTQKIKINKRSKND